MRLMLAMILAMSVATPALAADQFDLICNGVDHGHPEHARYRIDIATGEYCRNECTEIRKIQAITSGMITLYENQPKHQGDDTYYNTINRITGEWRWYSSSSTSFRVQDVRGSCEAALFSGLPSTKAKF